MSNLSCFSVMQFECESITNKLTLANVIWNSFVVHSLESPTRSLEMHAAQNIVLESRAGDISASCLTTFRLRSVAGSVST